MNKIRCEIIMRETERELRRLVDRLRLEYPNEVEAPQMVLFGFAREMRTILNRLPAAKRQMVLNEVIVPFLHNEPVHESSEGNQLVTLH